MKPFPCSRSGARLLSCACLLLGAGAAFAEPSQGSQRQPLSADQERSEEAVDVLYAGFARTQSAGAKVFVRLTAEVPVEPSREGKTLRYHLVGTRLGVPNNANPLPTGYFGSLVSRVALSQGKQGVDLVIELNEVPSSEQGTHRMVKHGDLTTLQVEFPTTDE